MIGYIPYEIYDILWDAELSVLSTDWHLSRDRYLHTHMYGIYSTGRLIRVGLDGLKDPF